MVLLRLIRRLSVSGKGYVLGVAGVGIVRVSRLWKNVALIVVVVVGVGGVGGVGVGVVVGVGVKMGYTVVAAPFLLLRLLLPT